MSDPYVLKNGVFILKGGKAGSGVPLESHVIPHGDSSVGAKLDELSQNLTNLNLTVPIYNEADDYFYVNGMKWQKGYFQRTTWFNSAIGYNHDVFGDLLNKGYEGNGSWYAGSVTIGASAVQFSHALTPSYSDTGYTATNRVIFRSETPINVTNFAKLVVTGSVSAGSTCYIDLQKVSDSSVVSIWAGSSTTWNKTELSLTSYEGEYYIRFRVGCHGTGKNTVYSGMAINELYFE